MLQNINNNKVPKIPDVCTNSYCVFHVRNELKITTENDYFYGITSNVAPSWWLDLVLYYNTKEERYLQNAKKYADNNERLVVFFPELLLNLNQQRLINEILDLLDYDKNIIIKTDSAFIIQSCASYPTKPKTMVYLGSFKN